MPPMSPRKRAGYRPASAYPGFSDHDDRPRAARRRPHPHQRRQPARAAGRPHRPGRAQRRRQDHHADDAGRRARAARRQGRRRPARSATCRRTRAAATSTSPPATGCCPPAASTSCRDQLVKAQVAMAEPADDAERDKAVRRYGRLEDQFAALGGYAAESDAARICTNLGLPDRVLGPAAAHPLRRPAPPHRAGPHPVLRRRDAAARRADQPPRRRLDHLAARLPDQPQAAGSSSSATTSSCSRPSSTRCGTSTPTAPRSTSTTSAGSATSQQRETDERRRKQERANTERKIDALMAQADKMRAKATKAKAAQEHGQAGRAAGRRARRRAGAGQGRQAAVPDAGAVRQDAADRRGTVQELRLAGDLHRRRPRGGPGHAGRRPRAQRRREDDAAADAGRHRARPTPARCKAGHGLRLGYYAQEHETLDMDRTPARGHALGRGRTAPTPSCAGSSARSSSPATTSTSRPACSPAARGPGWPWPPWSSPARTCCCSTSRPTTSTRSAASRCSTRCARYPGAIVLVTHDPGAVRALKPDKAILLPDGDEDAWSDDLADLVELA